MFKDSSSSKQNVWKKKLCYKIRSFILSVLIENSLMNSQNLSSPKWNGKFYRLKTKDIINNFHWFEWKSLSKKFIIYLAQQMPQKSQLLCYINARIISNHFRFPITFLIFSFSFVTLEVLNAAAAMILQNFILTFWVIQIEQ